MIDAQGLGRTHAIRLVDQSSDTDLVHATVVYHDRGEFRHHWQARCERCGWEGKYHAVRPGPAVDEAFDHGINHIIGDER